MVAADLRSLATGSFAPAQMSRLTGAISDDSGELHRSGEAGNIEPGVLIRDSEFASRPADALSSGPCPRCAPFVQKSLARRGPGEVARTVTYDLMQMEPRRLRWPKSPVIG